MSPQNIVGYNLLEGLRSHHSQIERWRAVGATGPAEVFIFPNHMLATYRSLPRWGPFSKYTTQELDNNRSAMIVPGVLQADLKGVRSLLGDGVSVGFAWHISAAISVLHDTGAAHGLLHPDFVGLDNNGQLCFRPALAAGIPSDPDPNASAQATDCWQLHFLFEALGVSEKVSSHLSLLLNGLCREKSIIRMAPGRSVRQALFAVCSRNTSWEEGLVKKLGDEWSLDSLPPMEQQIIPKLYPHLPRTRLTFPSSKTWDYEKPETSFPKPPAEQFNQPSRLREAFRRNTDLPPGSIRSEGQKTSESIVEKPVGIRIRLPSPSSVDNSFTGEVFDEIGVDQEASTVAQIQLPVSNRPFSNASSAGVKVSLPFNEDFVPNVDENSEVNEAVGPSEHPKENSIVVEPQAGPPPIRLQIDISPSTPPLEQPSLEQAPVEQASLEQAPVGQPSLEQAPVEQASLEQPSLEQASLEQPAVLSTPEVESKSVALKIEIPEPPISLSISEDVSPVDPKEPTNLDVVEEFPEKTQLTTTFVDVDISETTEVLQNLASTPSEQSPAAEPEMALTLELPPEELSESLEFDSETQETRPAEHPEIEEDIFVDEPETEDSIVEEEQSLLVLDLSQPSSSTSLEVSLEDNRSPEVEILSDNEPKWEDESADELEEEITSEEAEELNPAPSSVASSSVIISLEPEEFSEENFTNSARVFQPEEPPVSFSAFQVESPAESIQDSVQTLPNPEPFDAKLEKPDFSEKQVVSSEQEILAEQEPSADPDASEEQDDNFFAQFDPSELQQLEEDSKANLAQYADFSNDDTDLHQAEPSILSFVENSDEDSFSDEDKPKWEGLKGITADPSRESELGPGKWTEEARSIEELTKDMPTTPVREMELYEEGIGYGWILWFLGPGLVIGLLWLLWNGLG